MQVATLDRRRTPRNRRPASGASAARSASCTATAPSSTASGRRTTARAGGRRCWPMTAGSTTSASATSAVCGFGSTWICVCNGYNTKGHARGAGHARRRRRAGCRGRQQPANYGHWQVAGVRPGPEAAPNCRVYAYLWGTEYDAAGAGWNSLACQQIQVTAAACSRPGAAARWSTGPASPARRPTTGCALARAAGRICLRCRSGRRPATGLSPRSTPCPATPTWKSRCSWAMPMDDGAAACETLQPLAAGRRAWLVGAGQVWASAQTDAAVDLAVRTYTPITYRVRGEHVRRRRAAAADRAPGVGGSPQPAVRSRAFGSVYPPEVYVGDMLWLDRTLGRWAPAAAPKASPSGWRR